MVEKNGLSYGDYLQLDKILTAQTCQSQLHGNQYGQSQTVNENESMGQCLVKY